ncbi:MAG TPA: acyltransferase family protein [Mycobacteriales bacterium]|nr:acyltransferase family protein [Mycobacteriales bacterium]
MSWSYRPAFDGVRTTAVYLVLLFHSGVGVGRGGFIGVDLFFVLSGFLITNVLFHDVDVGGRIRFGRFYARRVRRLLPAAISTIAVTCVVFLLIDSVVQRLPMVRDAQSALLYVANWRFLHEQSDYFATAVDKSPFLHFWSLGIEEQFYVVFPLLLFGLSRAGRRRWVPTAGLTVLFALSVAAQLHWAGVDPNHAYYGTDARAYQLLAGAVLACAARTWDRRPPPWVADATAATGFAAVLLLGSNALAMSTSARGLAAMAASTALLAGLYAAPGGRTSGMLSRRTPVYLGQISYATYLWHWPVILVLRQLFALTPVEVALAAAGIATGLAATSSAVLEMPIRRSAALDRFRWPTVAVGVSCCALVAVVAVPPVLNSTRRPVLALASQPLEGAAVVPHHLAAAGPVGTARVRVPSDMNWSGLTNENGPGRTCTASDPQRCIVVRGRGLSIALVGDSYARMLAPMMIRLAREHDFTLSLNAISSCPWQAQLVNLHEPVADQQACTAARGGWYRTVLPELHPDVVLLASYPRDDEAVYGQTIKRIGGSSESLHDLIRNTTNETLAQITGSGARALILRSIYTTGFDPLDCLARATYVDQCAVRVPHSPPISDSFYRAAARQSSQVFTFAINRIVCPGRRLCLPMVDGITVWRNFNHFTTNILVHFRDRIWAAIQHSGSFNGLAASSFG